MSYNNLRDVYVTQLKDMYSAEKQLTEALPKMATASASDDLRQAFEDHLQQTNDHMESVSALLSELGENPGNKVCKAMQGLIEEGAEVIKESGEPAAKDAALIAAAQKVEHYEISTYGTLRAFAETLGYANAVARLDEVLNEEYEADQKLDDIAEGTWRRASVNERATA